MTIKTFLSVISILLCTQVCIGQNFTHKRKLKPIDYVSDIKEYDNHFYCSGFTHKTDNYDGYSSYAYLNKYNDTLGLIWSIKISQSPSNVIYSIFKHEKYIYALVKHGNVSREVRDENLHLYVITENGKIKETIELGKSVSEPSNITSKNDMLYFGYTEPSSIYPGEGSQTAVLLEYNCKTKKYQKNKGLCSPAFTNKAAATKSAVFLTGVYLNSEEVFIQQPFVLGFQNEELKESISKTENSEFVLDAFSEGDSLVVLTVFLSTNNINERYLKYQVFDQRNNEVVSNTILFHDLNWDNVSFKAYNDGASTWLLVDHSDSEENSSYIQMDSKGRILQRISSNHKINDIQNFFISDQYIISFVNNTLTVSNRTN